MVVRVMHITQNRQAELTNPETADVLAAGVVAGVRRSDDRHVAPRASAEVLRAAREPDVVVAHVRAPGVPARKSGTMAVADRVVLGVDLRGLVDTEVKGGAAASELSASQLQLAHVRRGQVEVDLGNGIDLGTGVARRR